MAHRGAFVVTAGLHTRGDPLVSSKVDNFPEWFAAGLGAFSSSNSSEDRREF